VCYHVRDVRKIAIRAVCDRLECRAWAAAAIRGLGFVPGEYPVQNITSGCGAPPPQHPHTPQEKI